ncbi:MAG TPA: Uma2 family endonuclease [Azospirillum sp.]|nr:Uma2 family endonuclease [Azospirillum sp.]
MGQPLPKPWTVAEFLEWERQQPERYEFVDGVIRMMTGGTNQHSRIKRNISTALQNALRGRTCEPWVEGPKVVTAVSTTYPDAVVNCGDVDAKDDRIENPVVIIEVLSRTTADHDRGGKWVAYQGIPSLQHYLLVSQDEPRVDVFTRDGTGWRLEVMTGLDAHIALPAIDCTLTLAEVYERVSF